MKKALKIIGISLASLVGLLLLIVGIACYMVFTPKRLTPIVSDVAADYLTCEHELKEVNLTFFRTFPYFGVEVKGLLVKNPTEGAPSDTVLYVPDIVVGVDIKQAIDGHIIVKEFALNDVEANIYIGADGQTNFDVLRLPADTTEETDTTAGSWQLKSIKLEEPLQVGLSKVAFIDEKDSLSASLLTTRLTLAQWRQGYQLDLTANGVSCRMGDTQWADSLQLTLSLPVTPTDDTYQRIQLGDVSLAINEFAIALTGDIAADDWTKGGYDCNLTLNTNPWRISSAIALLPSQYQSLIPKQIEADGTVSLEAQLNGRYDSVSMPIANARLRLTDAAGHYDLKVLPYNFDDIQADIQANVNLNDKSQTNLTVHRLYARTGETSINAKGTATNILKNSKEIALGNPVCNLTADLKMLLADANYFLPKQENTKTAVEGTMTGKVSVLTTLNDITEQRFEKVKMNGDLTINGLDAIYTDSIIAKAEQLHILFSAPRKQQKEKADILSADCQMEMQTVNAKLLAQDINAYITKGTVTAGIELNRKDTTQLPTIDATLHLGHINARMDTIKAIADALRGTAHIEGVGKKKSIPRLIASLSADTLNAAMGQGLKAATGKMSIEADATYRKEADNILLKWNPRIRMDLKNGTTDIAALDVPLDIPRIRFNYSNQLFTIDTSHIVLGNSDFSLAGEVKQLGKWLRKEDELLGDLRFTSKHTDVNQIIELVNRFTADNDSTSDKTTKKEVQTDSTKKAEPFIVPQRVNLQLLTVIRSADIFNEHLKNVGGKMYIQDGKLILEEMGFICEAAKLQLTAMYRTPRRNHIYVGLDYHMVDIDLQQLISMIPQLDTLVPMLKSFRGKAQFHIAAETYVNEKYELKTSTLRGACSIEGKDLVLIDGDTFRKMSKILMFSTKTENKFDSISAQIVAYKDQVTVYPFCVSIDNYMAALGGTHNLDMTFNYHVSLLKPLYIGVDVGGSIDNLSIKPAKCRYAKDFRPIIRRDTETRSAELRQMVSSSLKKNLKITGE